MIDENLGPQLPTRVLDLGTPGTTDVVLIETKGRRANYCALSYCWGPPGTQTLTTTQNNLEQRLSGIAFDSMPKTFQDAVQIARQISVRYLWIDGLCIIQGDAEDWARESKRMGGIYQQACLVIAASGAASPKDGCFVSTPRELSPVDLPFYSCTGQNDGCFHASVFRWEHFSPSFGPLRSRGWALQESDLARRSLYFMPGGPSWDCNSTDGFTERNTSLDLAGYSDWDSVLERFSCTKLTHKSDRLMAVEGIATELQKKTKDTYNRGVFLSQVTSNLLWMCQSIASKSDDLQDIPSWSWASKGARKLFWAGLGGPALIRLEAEIDQTKAHIDDQGCLRLQCKLTECRAHNIAFEKTKNPNDKKNQILFIVFSNYSDFPEQAVSMEGSAPQCRGIAVFDRERFDTIHCLYLMSTTLERLSEHLLEYGQQTPNLFRNYAQRVLTYRRYREEQRELFDETLEFLFSDEVRSSYSYRTNHY